VSTTTLVSLVVLAVLVVLYMVKRRARVTNEDIE
jgi:hypothetical protein